MPFDTLNHFCTILAYALHTSVIALLAVYLGAGTATLLGPGIGANATTRACASVLIAATTSSAVFHVLAAFGAWNGVAATLSLTALAVVLFAIRRRLRAAPLGSVLQADLRSAIDRALTLCTGRWAIVHSLLAVIALLIVARTLQSPPLAWDALTYHAVKPALWLQNGGSILLEAPGGWSTYRGRLSGAEIFGAWAMLSAGGDATWAAVDLVWWGMLALGIQLLSFELGVGDRDRAHVVGFACMLPPVLLAVGAGYVELPLAALHVSALALLLRAHRRPDAGVFACAGLALCLLLGMKLLAWPGVALLGVALAAMLLRFARDRAQRPAAVRTAGALLLAFVLVGASGPLRHWHATGYPLSVPVQLGSWALGPANADLERLEALVPTDSRGPQAELHALSRIFGHPLRSGPHFTWLGAAVLGLALLGAAGGLLRTPALRGRGALVALACAGPLLAYASPGFEIVRLHWADSNARHLLPALLPLVPLALIPGKPDYVLDRARCATARALLSLSAVAFGLRYATYGWAEERAFAIWMLFGCVVGALVVVTFAVRTRARPRAMRPTRAGNAFVVVICMIAAFTIFTSMLVIQSPAHRSALLRSATAFEPTPKYWASGASRLAALDAPITIAVTGGPDPAADGWFLYPLLGHRLDHRLIHIPHDAAWIARLEETDADYVFSFPPSSRELEFMERRPLRFEHVEGDRRNWGLYRLISE